MKIQSTGINPENFHLRIKQKETAGKNADKSVQETDTVLLKSNLFKENYLDIQNAIAIEQTRVYGLEQYRNYLKENPGGGRQDEYLLELLEQTQYKNRPVLTDLKQTILENRDSIQVMDSLIREEYGKISGLEKELAKLNIIQQNILSLNTGGVSSIIEALQSSKNVNEITGMLQKERIMDLLL